MRLLLPVVVLCAAHGLAATPETAAFCGLQVEPSPALTEPVEALQKKFSAVAREKSGYTLALRAEVDEAVKTARITDFAADEQLARVAVNARAKNAGAFSLRLTDRGDLLLQGRVVSAEGKLLKSALVSVPRNGEALLDALGRASQRFFDALNGTLAAEPAPTSTASAGSGAAAGKETPPPLVSQPVTPPNPGTPLRIAGGVLGAAGVAASVTGIVLVASAPTVQQDQFGNVAAQDVGKVPQVRAAQGAGLGALTAGVALTLTGALMFALAPSAPVTAAVAPTEHGAVFAVGGTF
jgi:hypothetical protein